jgi:hypothetical protein
VTNESGSTKGDVEDLRKSLGGGVDSGRGGGGDGTMSGTTGSSESR